MILPKLGRQENYRQLLDVSNICFVFFVGTGYLIVQPTTTSQATQFPVSVWAPTLEKATELYNLYNPPSGIRGYRKLHATVFDCSTEKCIPELTTSMSPKCLALCDDYFKCEMGKMKALSYPKLEHRLVAMEERLDDVLLLKGMIRKLEVVIEDQARRLLECEEERKRDAVT